MNEKELLRMALEMTERAKNPKYKPNEEEVTSFLSAAWELSEDYLSREDNADYEPDPIQVEKLAEAYGFFVNLALKNHGTVDPLSIIPKRRSVGISAYFYVLFIDDDQLADYCRIMSYSAGFSIDADLEGKVCISFNIPNVFRHK